MTGSLLTFLSPKIKMQHEDIATLSLCYIIGKSEALQQAFTKIMCIRLGIPFDDSIRYYKTQVSEKDKGRPDIIGFDGEGKEILICEAKFYAALTENQPEGYLEALKRSAGKGLVFLCPHDRIIGLWRQICSIVPAKSIPGNSDDKIVSIEGIRMGVMSWEELFRELWKASDDDNNIMKADLQELEGFCNNAIKNKKFIPFGIEDFGADVAFKIDRYYNVMDQTREVLLNKKEYGITQGSGKGRLQSATRWEGYAVYMASKTVNINIDLFFDREAWAEQSSIITPFWVGFDQGDWKQEGKLKTFLNRIPEEKKQKQRKIGIIMIALDPPIGLTLDESAHYMAKQVIDYLEQYKQFAVNA